MALGKANEVHEVRRRAAGADAGGNAASFPRRLWHRLARLPARTHLGAYEFAIGQTPRKDGKGAADGETFFVLGVDHPYAVISKDTPSLLPESAIAVRFHSIGGWGMITTGKNLGSIIGDFGQFISERRIPRTTSDGVLVGQALRHGQSEIWLGEKGRADQLLSDGRAANASR